MSQSECLFSKNVRLRKTSEFRAIYQHGRRYFSKAFIFLIKPNRLANARLGVNVSRKQVKLAVKRNRVKRICREYFRRRQHDLQGLDIVVIVTRSVASMTPAEMHQCMIRQWDKLVNIYAKA